MLHKENDNNEKTIKDITSDDLKQYLFDVAKEYRRLTKKKMPAEIVLIGGAAILTNYGFRDLTNDVDAIILASSLMKDAIRHVSDKYSLPRDWLNDAFIKSKSFSQRLVGISKYHRTYSNVVQIRIVKGEYLAAMKLLSGRRYKYDLSDIVGIFWEQEKNGEPISIEDVYGAISYLYGEDIELPESSQKILKRISLTDDYEALYHEIRKEEIESRKILLEFQENNPVRIRGLDINEVINEGLRRNEENEERWVALLESVEKGEFPYV